jgi:hypothetical protein
MAVKNIQYILFHLPTGKHISPTFLFSLPGKEPQIVPDFPQDRFRLILNFSKQHFLSAHVFNYPHNLTSSKFQTSY